MAAGRDNRSESRGRRRDLSFSTAALMSALDTHVATPDNKSAQRAGASPVFCYSALA